MQLPPKPRSFGDVQPAPILQSGPDPWGGARPVAEVYIVADKHSDGEITRASFTDINKAVELYETGCDYVANGTLKGVYLISPLGEIVAQKGEPLAIEAGPDAS